MYSYLFYVSKYSFSGHSAVWDVVFEYVSDSSCFKINE